ncbi:CaiB/BaiF CoA transferase family protein [Amycolatopsis thermophila]|uniref:Crotonobetainyl-CoA:carnitine CoA-transferase CaiB-like acyl-CoA transferase n=1 Tax=Amycolatopsis thermophila TaxID=206084 RepID=A0ABU0EWK7_9PSEU|nr:CaiB/BaiF CoA-transferase family protein [Amycolatopsis thermophila]MDQ0379494.1 crotonobetainyl-CoA:carnitine CoA-transferase CaiB-like acyl-CoA transferase [Amycolatopsis thermophila]
MSRALEGIRVVELCEIMQGPLAGQTLGDLGADVVKVERGERGDAMRTLDREAVDNGHVSSYFVALNRNKRSVVLDLKTAGGREILHRLLADADVLVHNYRPHAIRRLGLSYADLAPRYPRLVYGSASGFGATGPLAHKPGQDMLAQTVSGLARAVGDPRLASYLNPTAQVDYASGMGLVQGILAALLERERSGRGQEVHVNLLDTAVAMQMLEAAAHSMYAEELNWVTQWYGGTFRTTDGVVTVLGLFRDNAVRLICDALEIPDLSLRPELATTELQARNKDFVNEVVAPVVAGLSTAEALGRFEAADLLCAPQLALPETLQHPQIAANELLVDVDVPGQDRARVVGYPVRLSRSRADVRRAVPRLGQHTCEVLAELGYSPWQIAEFTRQGAVRADHIAQEEIHP